MSELTKGLRLAFTPGLLGLHFRIGNEPDSYPNDMDKGARDMAYINRLIAIDQGTLCRHCGREQDPDRPCQCYNDE